jgi:hypothetical protein
MSLVMVLPLPEVVAYTIAFEWLVNSKIHGAITNRAKHSLLCLMLPVIVLERLGLLECSESNARAS